MSEESTHVFLSDKRDVRESSWNDSADWQAGVPTNVRIHNDRLRPKPVRPPSGVSRWNFESDLSDSWGENGGIDRTSSGYQSGAIGNYAKQFDGNSDRVVIPHSTSLQFESEISISAWTYWAGGGDNNMRVLTKRTNPLTRESYGLAKDQFLNKDDSLAFRLYVDGEFSTVDSPNPMPTNVWVHWVGTWDGTTQRLYKNGNEVASKQATGTLVQNNDNLGIGGRGDGENDWWKGALDDIQLYSKSLSASEVSNLFKAGHIFD